jgi:hypothetical protein
VTLELGHRRQRPRIDAIDEQRAVEMVDLVLEGGGGQPDRDLINSSIKRNRCLTIFVLFSLRWPNQVNTHIKLSRKYHNSMS